MLKKYLAIYLRQKMSRKQAVCKVCQDIMFEKLRNSSLNKSLALKGGTVMYQLTGAKRIATEDLDFDVIKMAMNQATIDLIITELNNSKAYQKIKLACKPNSISVNESKEYYSMRYTLLFSDVQKDVFELKVDMGVHKNIEIKQPLLPFDVMGESSSIDLQINPPEQIVIEKTTSILTFGLASTRMKDIMDNYWIIKNYKLDDEILKQCIDLIIIKDGKAESTKNYFTKVISYYNNPKVMKSLKGSRNWLSVTEDVILKDLHTFFTDLLGRVL